MATLFNRTNTIALVALLTLWRLYLSAGLQLHPDEAYYWLWSRHLDIGYYDHSPLVAYFIWFTTLFSQAELWVRLSGTLTTLLISVLMWRLSLQLFGSVLVASASVILFNVYPFTMLGMIVITPDIPVFLFWSLSVYLFWQIMRGGDTWLWYALGLCFGLALLSKYTAILLLPCLFLYLLLTDDRRWLKTRHPYLALLIGLSCFLPVMYWNYAHDWVSFAFQFRHGLGGQEYAISRVGEYLGGQILIVGPVAIFIGLFAAFKRHLWKDKEYLFLILVSLPILLFFGFSSMKKLAGPNWTVFAYFALTILLTKYFLDSGSRIKKGLWFFAFISSLLVSSIISLHAKFGVIPLDRISRQLAVADASNQFYGWQELAAALTQKTDVTFAIAHSHQLAAELLYYTKEKLAVQTDPETRPSQFNLWPWPQGLAGKNGVYVWDNEDVIGHYEDYIAPSSAIEQLPVMRGRTEIRSYSIVHGRGKMVSPRHSNSPLLK